MIAIDFDDADDSFRARPTHYYADGDGDGFGDLNQTTFACILPQGFVENSLDCNDANPSITLPLWYLDNDGDGDGDINNTFENCEPLENYVEIVVTVMTIIEMFQHCHRNLQWY